MAITRTQIARQLYQAGGGADFGAPDKAAARASGYGNPGGGLAKTNAPSQNRISEIKQANEVLNRLAEDKAQEPFETLIVKENNLPGFFGMGLNLTQKPRQFTLDRNVDFYRFDPRTKKAREKYGLTAQGYKDYMSARQAGNIDAAGNTIINNDDDDNFIPVDTTFNMESGNTDQGTTEEEPFEISRRFRAEGGIMNSDVVGGEMDFDSARQMYGLGKLVKKIGRSVKKIAKSPIGKAALLYTGLGGLGSLAQGGSFFTNFANPLSQIKSVGSIFAKGGLDNIMARTGLGKFVEAGPGKAVLEKNFLGKALTSPSALISAGSAIAGLLTPEQEEEAQTIADNTGIDIAEIRANPNKYLARRFRAEGGSMDEPVAKKTMPLLDMDGQEMDLRAEGGFVPIGRMEKADDVPARLSKNEFVFTAEAVRNAGEGDVDKGAEVMYNMMKNLESGGEVSEESQGLEGAREMFQTSQRLEEVI